MFMYVSRPTSVNPPIPGSNSTITWTSPHVTNPTLFDIELCNDELDPNNEVVDSILYTELKIVPGSVGATWSAAINVALNELDEIEYSCIWQNVPDQEISPSYYIRITIGDVTKTNADVIYSEEFLMQPESVPVASSTGGITVTVTGGGTFVDVKALVESAGGEESILADRLLVSDPSYSKATEPEKKAQKDSLATELKKNVNFDKIPAVVQIKQEIATASSFAKTIGNNIPLICTPITAATAAMAIASVLPDFLEVLSNLGLLDKLPPAVMTTLQTITTILTSISKVIGALNTALNAVFALINSDIKDIIPSPPSITISGPK